MSFLVYKLPPDRKTLRDSRGGFFGGPGDRSERPACSHDGGDRSEPAPSTDHGNEGRKGIRKALPRNLPIARVAETQGEHPARRPQQNLPILLF